MLAILFITPALGLEEELGFSLQVFASSKISVVFVSLRWGVAGDCKMG